MKPDPRLRHRLPTSNTVVAATMHKETACCQSMFHFTPIQRVRKGFIAGCQQLGRDPVNMGVNGISNALRAAPAVPSFIPLASISATRNTRLVTSAIFHHPHRVTYAECTVGNHIYYSRYLDLLEAARGEFFRSAGISLASWQEKGVIFPVCECRLRYKAPARYDDTLDITLWLTLARGVRLNFAYRILNAAGQTLVEAETLHACAGLDDKPRRLPEDLLPRLMPYLESPG